jgi:hypothetical protein
MKDILERRALLAKSTSIPQPTSTDRYKPVPILEKQTYVAQTNPVKQPYRQPVAQPSWLDDLTQGLQRSSSAAPFMAPPTQESETFGGRLAQSAGEVAGDIPAMALGASPGALLGGLIGSIFGPAGTGIGAMLGGGAGAFAAPTAVKSIAREARKGSGITSGIGNVAYDVGKSSLIGATTGLGGKFAQPLVKALGSKLGGKILSSALGRGATTVAGEIGGMAAGQKIAGEDVSAEGLAQNAILMGGMKAAGALSNKLPFKKIQQWSPETLLPEKSAKNKQAFKLLHETLGEKNARAVESSFKWKDALKKAQVKGEFSPENLEDMIYYRQKTGNPTIEGDTFKELSNRLPEHAKEFVDTVIDQHLKNSLNAWNDNPLTRNISPREGMGDIYLPGMYEGSPEEIAKAMTQVNRRFTKKNPFSNPKEFLNYHEALTQAGLKPRYKNIIELMGKYDQVMAKSLVNTELIQKIHDIQKDTGEQLIVRSSSKRAYQEAKANGYIPFNDPYLRRFVKGSKNGKPDYGTTESPALIDPEYAPAFQGIFQKDAPVQESKFWKGYDALADSLRRWHVHPPFLGKIAHHPLSTLASPFHATALTEHAVSALGPNIRKWFKAGRELRNNKEWAVDAARHGLTLDRSDVDVKGKSWLFGELQPNYKAATYDKFTQDIINKQIESGMAPDDAKISEIKRETADFVNSLYGGQQWEALGWFNDPKNMKIVRRMVGYPDWSLSAIKNAGWALKEGPVGDMARKTWAKYGIFFFGTRALMDAFNSAWYQSDPDEKVSGIKFDPERFVKNLSLTGKPGQRELFSLPDVPVTIAGTKFNPGRDEKGGKRYAHLGKSALELGSYVTKPVTELFNKSNPVFQAIFKQVIGYTPSEYGNFPVQGKYVGREMKPWGGADTMYDQLVSRSKQLATETLPFSMRALVPESITGERDRGVDKFIGSYLGAVPVSKGRTPFKVQGELRHAITKKDEGTIEQIRQQLIDNGYSPKKVNTSIKALRKAHAKKMAA